ncbi:9704_t:CDS:1, partial [Racocetra persica]
KTVSFDARKIQSITPQGAYLRGIVVKDKHNVNNLNDKIFGGLNTNKVKNINTEDNISNKFNGKKMEPNYLLSRYKLYKHLKENIHIIVQLPAAT